MAVNMRISIVITNYNMGRFVGAAVQSALDVRWPDKEVIVCDDGSTDDSREIIDGFGDRIVVVHKPNGGQPSAANAVFPLITGDVVFFLDSDDMLAPDAAEAVMQIWDGRTSKVQFPSLIIDQHGIDIGRIWPGFRESHTPQRVRTELLRTGIYPTASTSGNAFGIAFLRKLFPVPEDLRGFDSYLCTTAPLYGDVRTITKPLAKFRIHDRNSWSQQTWAPEKLLFYVDQEIRRDAFLRQHATKLGLLLNRDSLRANHVHMMNRLASMRVFPGQQFSLEGRGRVVLDGLKAVFADSFASRKAKVLIACWFVLVGFGPGRVATRMIKARYVIGSRSRLLETVLQLAGAVRFDKPLVASVILFLKAKATIAIHSFRPVETVTRKHRRGAS